MIWFALFAAMAHPYRFLGNSVLWWDLKNDVTISAPWYMGLVFRTRAKDGVLLQAQAEQYTHLIFQVCLPLMHFVFLTGFNKESKKLQKTVTVWKRYWKDLWLSFFSKLYFTHNRKKMFPILLLINFNTIVVHVSIMCPKLSPNFTICCLCNCEKIREIWRDLSGAKLKITLSVM